MINRFDQAIQDATNRAQQFRLLNGGSGIGSLVAEEAEKQLQNLIVKRDVENDAMLQRERASQVNIPALNLAQQQSDAFSSLFPPMLMDDSSYTAPVDTTVDPLTESITGKDSMYGSPGITNAGVNMGGSLGAGGGLGSFVAPVSARDMFVTDPNFYEYEKSFEIDPAQEQISSSKTYLAPMSTKFSGVGPGTQFSNKGEMIQQGPGVTSGKYASSQGGKGSPNYLKALGDSQTAFNAQMEASRRNDLASAMQTLYGAAGSSFESGRNEYTESGDYARDKAIRDAEFDAMRAGNAPLTREETAKRLAELQASIGFGGAMAPANAPMSTRVEPNPIPTNFELVSGYNVPAPSTTVADNTGIAPLMGVPSTVLNRNRSRGGGKFRK